MPKVISLEDVKKHRHKKSVWIIIHNDVYDVTKFLIEHPGGEDSIMDVAGMDGTQEFEDVGHSDDARELLKKYKIGSLSPKDQITDTPCCHIKKRKSSSTKSQCSLCSATSCPHLPKSIHPEKSWRTFDGSNSPPPPTIKSESKTRSTPRPERRVQSIIVPRESSGKLKWALIFLGAALIVGFAYRKYVAK